MITINGFEINQKHFPDNSLCLMDFPCNDCFLDNYQIIWKYENDGELFTLICCVKHIREVLNPTSNITLRLFYCPHARLDRVKSTQEVFTLKYFCEIINSLNFNKVFLLDPHSNVSTALLDRVEVIDIELYVLKAIQKAFANTPDENRYVYFPDEGSMKRYGDLKCFKNCNIMVLYGKKIRIWKTGEIKGLKIYDFNDNRIDNTLEKVLEGKTVLMIDDIISYGGTMYYSAKKLKELGAEKIYAYATHVENSVLDKEKRTFIKTLEDNTVQQLFTANTIYSGMYEKIQIL